MTFLSNHFVPFPKWHRVWAILRSIIFLYVWSAFSNGLFPKVFLTQMNGFMVLRRFVKFEILTWELWCESRNVTRLFSVLYYGWTGKTSVFVFEFCITPAHHIAFFCGFHADGQRHFCKERRLAFKSGLNSKKNDFLNIRKHAWFTSRWVEIAF